MPLKCNYVNFSHKYLADWPKLERYAVSRIVSLQTFHIEICSIKMKGQNYFTYKTDKHICKLIKIQIKRAVPLEELMNVV